LSAEAALLLAIPRGALRNSCALPTAALNSLSRETFFASAKRRDELVIRKLRLKPNGVMLGDREHKKLKTRHKKLKETTINLLIGLRFLCFFFCAFCVPPSSS
jgi:hypothetical protein